MERFGKYELVRKLATGGVAEVFLARAEGPLGFEKIQVIKRILPRLAAMPAFVDRFLSEAKLAAKLDHPNIVQIFDFGQHDGLSFIAMEYIDGPSVRAICRQRRQLGVALPPALCARLVSLACEGLGYAHEFRDPLTGKALGILHRDVTPENILVSRAGVVKVVDFGLAKAADLRELPAATQADKYKYRAPEHLQRQALDRRIDVYSLGVVLYELLTGATPFDSAANPEDLTRTILQGGGTPAAKLRQDLPRDLARVLDRALGPRDQRFPSCRELQAELESFIHREGAPVGPQLLSQWIADLGVLPEPWAHNAMDLESTRVASAGEITRLARGSTTAVSGEFPLVTVTSLVPSPAPSGGFTLPGGPPPLALGSGPSGSFPTLPGGHAEGPPPPLPAASPYGAEPLPPPVPDVAVAPPREETSAFTNSSLTREVVDLRPAFPEEIHTNVHVRNPSLELTQLEGELPQSPFPRELPMETVTVEPGTLRRPMTSGGPAQVETVVTRRRYTSGELPAARSWVGPVLVAVFAGALVGAIGYFVLKPAAPFPVAREQPPAAAAPPVTAAAAPDSSLPRNAPSARARVRISTPVPATVRVNGTVMGPAPVELRDVAPEEIRIEISNPELGFRKQAWLVLRPGDNGTKEIPLSKLPVELKVRPRARVAVDGKDVGEFETKRLELYEGWHDVQLVDRHGKRKTEKLIVLPDQANRFSYDLSR